MSPRRNTHKRRKAALPTRKAEPPLVVNCVCCHCDTVFKPSDISGSYLNRRCPSCGGELNESNYDIASRQLREELVTINERMSASDAESRKWESWALRCKWAFLSPLRKRLERKAAEYRTAVEDLTQKHAIRGNRFSILAQSRYYTSEWYQRTRIPLMRKVVSPYKLNVGFDEDGVWYIRQTDKLGSGIMAEYLVFQRLLGCVRDATSPLFGAQIVPNIYLNHEQRGDKAEKLWTQIDCLLLTRQAAFVIEVKRRRKHVFTSRPFEMIWSSNSCEKMPDQFSSNEGNAKPTDDDCADESFALDQNSSHAVEFDSTCDAFPFERIYEQVVYVGTRSFHTDCAEFVDNVNVSYLSADNSDLDFADIIENECERLEDTLDQERLDELGESLVASYGDLNQMRAQLHVQRIKDLVRTGS